MSLQEILMLTEVLLIAGTVIITLFTYFKNIRDKRKSRALMIMYQIKDIQNNIKYIKENCYVYNYINDVEFHKSNLIYTKNLWDENKVFIANKLSIESYDILERFYYIAATLLDEQKAVKKSFASLLEAKEKIYIEEQLKLNFNTIKEEKVKGTLDDAINIMISQDKEYINKAINIGIDNFIPKISYDIVRVSLDNYEDISDGYAYQELRKIAGIRR